MLSLAGPMVEKKVFCLCFRCSVAWDYGGTWLFRSKSSSRTQPRDIIPCLLVPRPSPDPWTSTTRERPGYGYSLQRSRRESRHVLKYCSIYIVVYIYVLKYDCVFVAANSKLRGKPTTLNLGNSEKQEIKL